MANRMARTPGTLREFDLQGRISEGVPDFAVDVGGGFDILAKAAGSLSERLRGLADAAMARDGAAQGLAAGKAAGDPYLAQREAEARAAATERAGGDTQVRAPAAVREAISAAAAKHGVSAETLMRIAQIESSLNPNAKNPNSSAGGLFQFIDSTAAQYGLKNRYDPHQAADAGARLLKDNAAHLRRTLGREPTTGELYLAHQQGAGGAAKLLGNPNARAVDVVGADAVRLNGGHAGMTAGEFATLWTRKGGSAVATTHGLPALSGAPLALRRDGTPAGEAHDAAAIEAYGWRLDAGISTDLANAADEFRDDPAGLMKRIGEIRAHYLADDNLADPDLREAFDRNFAKRAEAYGREAIATQERKLLDEREAAATTALDARRTDLERQAFALGANPEGDRILSGQLAAAGRSIDAAAASGAISPDQAMKRKADLAETAARGRAIGVFEALPGPEEKERFATGMLDEWAKGEGPLAALPLAAVKGLSAELFSRARQEKNERDAGNALRRAELSRMARDDLASVAATGQGLDLGKAGSSMTEMAAGLGEKDFAAWSAARDAARRQWQASAGLETMTEEQIGARLRALAPTPGQPGYDDAEQTFEAATKKAEALLKAREKDPAAAAQEAFPKLAEMAANANPDDPASLQALATARMDAQAALGVSELARQPLTGREARALAASVTRSAAAAKKTEAMRLLADQMAAAYGGHGEAAMRQVLEADGMDKALAEQGAAFFARAQRGERPMPAAARRQAGVADETAAAEGAAKPRGGDAFPLPNHRQEQMLLGNPDLAPQFDAKFGTGAAERLLGRLIKGTDRKVEGGMLTRDAEGEGFIPDGR